jgi:hypothetical protein
LLPVAILPFCLASSALAFELEIPLDVSILERLVADVPLEGERPIAIALALTYDEKGKLTSDGTSTVDGTPVTVKGTIKSRQGVEAYELSLRGDGVSVRIAGEIGESGSSMASVRYRGPRGKIVAPAQEVTISAAAIGARISLSPEIDAKGKITGDGVIHGYGLPIGAPLRGKFATERISWTLKFGSRNVSFKGVRQTGDPAFIGTAKVKLPPAKSTLVDFPVPIAAFALARAGALRDQGLTATENAMALAAEFGLDARLAAGLLRDSGYDLASIGRALTRVFSAGAVDLAVALRDLDTPEAIVDLLRESGFGVRDVFSALKDAFRIEDEVRAEELLIAADFVIEDILALTQLRVVQDLAPVLYFSGDPQGGFPMSAQVFFDDMLCGREGGPDSVTLISSGRADAFAGGLTADLANPASVTPAGVAVGLRAGNWVELRGFSASIDGIYQLASRDVQARLCFEVALPGAAIRDCKEFPLSSLDKDDVTVELCTSVNGTRVCAPPVALSELELDGMIENAIAVLDPQGKLQSFVAANNGEILTTTWAARDAIDVREAGGLEATIALSRTDPERLGLAAGHWIQLRNVSEPVDGLYRIASVDAAGRALRLEDPEGKIAAALGEAEELKGDGDEDVSTMVPFARETIQQASRFQIQREPTLVAFAVSGPVALLRLTQTALAGPHATISLGTTALEDAALRPGDEIEIKDFAADVDGVYEVAAVEPSSRTVIVKDPGGRIRDVIGDGDEKLLRNSQDEDVAALIRGECALRDGGTGEFVLPYHNTDSSTLDNGQVPTYFSVTTVRPEGQLLEAGLGQLRIRYWWYYGHQPPCLSGVSVGDLIPALAELDNIIDRINNVSDAIDFFDIIPDIPSTGIAHQVLIPANKGEHIADWEHIDIYTDVTRTEVLAVKYYQHTGAYTKLRRDGEIEFDGERPVIYVGELAHGSYHDPGSGADEGVPIAGACVYFGDRRGKGRRWDTTSYLVSLAGDEEPWMAADRTANWDWGYARFGDRFSGSVGTHPAQRDKFPTAVENACEGFGPTPFADAGCFRSFCPSGTVPFQPFDASINVCGLGSVPADAVLDVLGAITGAIDGLLRLVDLDLPIPALLLVDFYETFNQYPYCGVQKSDSQCIIPGVGFCTCRARWSWIEPSAVKDFPMPKSDEGLR